MGELHVFFFPLLAQGHMLPTIDMAKLFSFRGVKATLVTTHYHAFMFSKSIQHTRKLGFDISVRSIDFPSNEAGLPQGIHSLDQAAGSLETLHKFNKACNLMQESVELLIEELRPNALIADMFYPWTTDSAAKFGIPRLLFHGSSSFAMSATESVRRNTPYKNLKSHLDSFVVPDLPHKIMLTKGQIFGHGFPEEEEETEMSKHFKAVTDSEDSVYGVVVNSFYELEPDYVDYYKNVLGRRAWHIGPFFLSKTENHHLEISERGGKSAIDGEECLKWLDSKDPNSVVFVCFGSMAAFKASQLHEIAMGLEESDQQFIWVVSKCIDEENWLPEDFKNRVGQKGLIIKGWAPQMLILEHKSIGAFVTHCGWNSTLEGACVAGVPFVTWPLFADQFYNEKLVTDVLRTGVGVGCQQWSNGAVAEVIVKRDALSGAIRAAMVGDEAVKMRGRAKMLKMMAEKAVEEDVPIMVMMSYDAPIHVFGRGIRIGYASDTDTLTDTPIRL